MFRQYGSVYHEEDMQERVAVQLRAFASTPGWERGRLSSHGEVLANRTATPPAEELMLSDSTRSYGVYFRSQWLPRTSQCVPAFRSGAYLTTNNALESWHDTT